MSAEFEDLRREGTRPAIIPNAGRCQTLVWTIADAQRFVELVREAFPNVFLYEDFGWRNHLPEKPEVRILQRADEPGISHDIEGFFPYPGWRPELVQVESRHAGYGPYWTWARYLSPRFSFGLPSDLIRRPNWAHEDRPRVQPFETWAGRDVKTSYRRELLEERRIQDKIIRLARKLCVRTVPVKWKCAADYLEGNGTLWAHPKRPVEGGWATPATIAWCKAAPNRVLAGCAWISGGAYGYLPVECVPEAWWQGRAKPKWAQRP